MALVSALGNVSLVKAHEAYVQGVLHLQAGRLEAAILTLQESVFFSPENVNPLVALAECYVFLCDFQSAVRLYRAAQWILQRKVRETEREAIRKARDEAFNPALLLFATDPKLVAADTTGILGLPPGGMSSAIPVGTTGSSNAEGGASSISIPSVSKEGKADFENDRGVQEAAVLTRLAGLQDALGLAHYKMSDFSQALRLADDALATLEECEEVKTRKAGSPRRPPAASTGMGTSTSRRNKKFVDPTVSLHRAVYLIALRREEEAEFQLEAHTEQFPEFAVQSGALLIQLYCNRQAFRPARLMLEKHVSAVRHERSLTIAQHCFFEKYNHYRLKALKERDMGTISKCIEVYPNDVELLFLRASILIESDQHKKSVKDLFRCIKETNGNHKQAVEAMTSVLFKIGSTLDGEEGIQEAITYYSESLKWRSDNTLVILARADCYLKLEDYENALVDYRRILQLDPDHHTANQRIAFLHDLWGRKMYTMGKVKEAEVEFTNAIKTDDKVALFYYHRALCRFELNESRYGLRDVLSCQQLNPAEPRIRAFIVRYLGSNEVPDTSKESAKVAHDQQLVRRDNTGKAHLNLGGNSEALPKQYPMVIQRAADLYGLPSARIAKELMEEQDDAEAVCAGPFPARLNRRELMLGITGRTGPQFKSYDNYVTQQPPRRPVDARVKLSGAKCRLQPRAKK